MGAKIRFHLALGFLLWSILPHFSLTLHAHDRDGEGHAHALLSRSQLEQAQTLAASAAAAFGEASLDPDYGLAGDGSSQPAGHESREAGLACSHPALHGHYQEEANTLSTPWPPLETLVHPAPAPSPAPHPIPFAGRPVHAASARGPPA